MNRQPSHEVHLIWGDGNKHSHPQIVQVSKTLPKMWVWSVDSKKNMWFIIRYSWSQPHKLGRNVVLGYEAVKQGSDWAGDKPFNLTRPIKSATHPHFCILKRTWGNVQSSRPNIASISHTPGSNTGRAGGIWVQWLSWYEISWSRPTQSSWAYSPFSETRISWKVRLGVKCCGNGAVKTAAE